MISCLVFGAPSAPRIIDFTSTAVTLNASINETSQRNFCRVNRVEFKCTDIDNVSTSKAEKFLSFQLSELKPFSDYKCYTRMENVAGGVGEPQGYSPYSEERSFKTKEGRE